MVKTSRTLLLTSAAVVALSVTPQLAMAGPEGGVVVGGSANISQSGAKTDIHQHSNKAILDWRSFDITAQEHVEFHQPSSNAMALNRIRDTKPSQIDGKLTANGHVMLINPNGVVFGSGAQVDVGSLTATTADIDNNDFMNGNLDFDKAGQIDAAIINEGSITVKEAGLVNLVAPSVENHGIIQAKLGKVQLAAADTFTLDMAGDGLLQVAVTDEQAAKLARNTGRITAESGTIALTASRARSIVDSLVENSGIIEAHSMTKVGGKVILGGSHTKVSGSINANGKTGGGEVLIGGDYQGKAIENVTTAKVTEVTNTAVIKTNATDQGNGGKVIVWADGATRYEGIIEAKGGPNGGDGGFVEVSGKKYLEYAGNADLSGDTLGTLLLDPDDMDIVAGAANPGEFADDLIAFAENGGATSTLGADTLSGRLSANANVILQANNTIDVNADVTSTGSGDLTLQTGTGGTITVNNAIDVNTGDLTLQADEIDINANLAGTGDIQLTSADVAQEIEIGSTYAAALNLTAAELSNLTNGWNSITIGANDHTGGTQITESVSFADNTILRQDQVNANAGITTSFANIISTTDNADFSVFSDLYTSQNWRLNVAGDALFDGMGSHLLTSGSISGDLTVQNTAASGLHSVANLTVGGNITVDVAHAFDMGYSAATNLQADGDIDITSSRVNIFTGSTLSGNADGSSNLTFLEYGEDEAMEIGGTGVGSTWQMTDDEFATIQNSFANVTFGSSSMTGDVVLDTLTRNFSASLNVYGNNVNVNGISSGAGSLSVFAQNVIAINDDLTKNGGIGTNTYLFEADRNININNADILANSGGINVTLNADSEANQDGAIFINGASITTNGGDFIAGGGLDPLTGYASKSSAGTGHGVVLLNSSIDAGGGDISALGRGSLNASCSNNCWGIYTSGASVQTSGAGVITFDGIGGGDAAGVYNTALHLNNSSFTSENGDMVFRGQKTGTAWTNYGVSPNGVTFTTTGTGSINIITSNSRFYNWGGNTTITSGNDINIEAYELQLNQTLMNIAAVDTLTMTSTAGRTIGVGTTGQNIFISDALLAKTSAANYVFGGQSGTDNFSGDIIVNTAHDFGDADVTFRSGADIDLAGTLTKNTGAGTVDYIFEADRNIVNSNNADVVRNDGTINLALNSDKDEDQDGAIALSNFTFDSNNGDFIAGGGANPLTTAAYGGQDGVYDIGVELDNTQITTGTSNISIRGEGEDTNAGNTGVSFFGGTSLISTSGDITIHGKAGNGTNTNIGFNSNALIRSNDGTISLTGVASGSSVNNFGIRLPGGNIQTTGNGDIILDGTGGDGTSNNYGIYLQAAAAITSTGTGTDAGTITLNGTGGDGTDNNYGIYLLDDNTQITSVDGAISLTGVGGAASGNDNDGIKFLDGADILSTGTSANAATITLDGDASRGAGITIHGGTIQSGYGDIQVSGDTTSGYGIILSNWGGYSTATGTKIISTGDDSLGDAANIAITGNGTTNGVHLHVGAALETDDGDIDVTANTNGNGGSGLYMRFTTYIDSTGDGNVTLSGTSNSTTNGELISGVDIRSNSYVRAADGDINITGQGGNSVDAMGNGHGISITESRSYISSSGAGDITLDGTAGDCTNGGCYGVYLNNSSSGTDHYIRSISTGNIDITGRGGNVGSGNYGIFIEGGSDIESTMTGANAGTITLHGTGGNGDDNNHGIYITGTDTRVTSVDGAMSFTGQGGSNGTIGSSDNYGIYVADDADITSTGTSADAATIIFNGTGGNGDDNNYGNYILGIGTTVTSVDGDIDITGYGGSNGLAGSNSNHGIELHVHGLVSSTGTSSEASTITINGYGGDGHSYNVGIDMTGSSSITSGYGDIFVNGYGGSGGVTSGIYNSGVRVSNGSHIRSSGAGADAANLILTGTGGAKADYNSGFRIESTGNVTSVDGDIDITGIGGTNGLAGSENNYGINVRTNGYISTSGAGLHAGTITLTGYGDGINNDYGLYIQDNGSYMSSVNSNYIFNADSFYSDASNFFTTSGNGNLTIRNRTAGASIGLGGGAGTLNLTDAELAQFSVGGNLVIGSSTAGAVHIDSVDFTGITANNVNLLGGDFTIDGAVDAANSITMIANGDMTLNGGVSATGAGNSVVLVADGFTNTGGAGAINAGAGRYLAYVDAPSTTSKGGLVGANYYNRSYAGNAPASITETGDLFLYEYQPTLNFSADDITLNTFNPNFNSFTYSVSGLETGDSLLSVFSGNPAFSKSQQSPGIYRINGGLGSLSSLIGYDFAFVPGMLTMLSPAQQIPSTVEYQTQIPDSFFAGNNSITISYADNDFGSSPLDGNTASGEPSAQKQRVQIKRDKQRINDTSSENDAGVRMVEADLLEIEEPIIEFYDLCSYNIKYCQ